MITRTRSLGLPLLLACTAAAALLGGCGAPPDDDASSSLEDELTTSSLSSLGNEVPLTALADGRLVFGRTWSLNDYKRPEIALRTASGAAATGVRLLKQDPSEAYTPVPIRIEAAVALPGDRMAVLSKEAPNRNRDVDAESHLAILSTSGAPVLSESRLDTRTDDVLPSPTGVFVLQTATLGRDRVARIQSIDVQGLTIGAAKEVCRVPLTRLETATSFGRFADGSFLVHVRDEGTSRLASCDADGTVTSHFSSVPVYAPRWLKRAFLVEGSAVYVGQTFDHNGPFWNPDTKAILSSREVCPRIAKYDSKGSADASFATGDELCLSSRIPKLAMGDLLFTSSTGGHAYAALTPIGIDASGRLLASGEANYVKRGLADPFRADTSFLRFASNGGLDAAYAGRPNVVRDVVRAAVVPPNGKPLVSTGKASYGTFDEEHAKVLRITP